MARTPDRRVHEPPVTTLGKETVFSGKLKFSQTLKIDGKFDGEIDATGKLYIDEGATVTARIIRASSIIISGIVHGDIIAQDKLEMLPTAKVYGNVKTSRLRIADGVIFEGSCDMIRDPKAFNPFAGD